MELLLQQHLLQVICFSLDGIHLAPQGNALVANYFIDAINTTYNANIPHTVVSSYPGIEFP